MEKQAGRRNKMYFSADGAVHTLTQENVKLIWGQNETLGDDWRGGEMEMGEILTGT